MGEFLMMQLLKVVYLLAEIWCYLSLEELEK